MSNFVFKSFRLALCSAGKRNSLRQLPSTSVLTRHFTTSQACYNRSQIPRKVVYLGNLPFNTNVGEVKEIAEQYGSLARITMPADERDRPGGFANVEFQNEEDARNFYEATRNGITVGGRKSLGQLVEKHLQEKLRLARSAPDSSSKLFLTNFPREPTTKELESLFHLSQEQLADIKIGSSYKGHYAHVRFTSTEAAVEAMKAHQNKPLSIDGQALQISYSEVAKSPRLDQPSSVLHFRGRLDQDELNHLLEPYQSEIKSIQYIRSRGSPTQSSQSGFIICKDTPTATSIFENCRDKVLLWYAQNYVERQPSAYGRRSERPNSTRRKSYGDDWGGNRESKAYRMRREDD